jgi:hypothetical protein
MYREYIDGGLQFNNPVSVAYEESQLISSRSGNQVIDMMLSVGTCRNSNAEGDHDLNSPALMTSGSNEKRPWWGTIFKLIMYQFEVNTATERAWHYFHRQDIFPNWQRERFHRINLDLGYEPPKLDDVKSMAVLQDDVKRILKTEPRIERLAVLLIASSFYFQRSPQRWSESDGFIHCPGKSYHTAAALKKYYVNNMKVQFVAASRMEQKSLRKLASSSARTRNTPASSSETYTREVTIHNRSNFHARK